MMVSAPSAETRMDWLEERESWVIEETRLRARIRDLEGCIDRMESDHHAELLRLQAIVDALPRCVLCHARAMWLTQSGSMVCDAHALRMPAHCRRPLSYREHLLALEAGR